MATSAEQDKAAGSSEESGDDVSYAQANLPTVTAIEIGLAHMRIRDRMRESNPAVTERVLCDVCDTPNDAFLYCEECSVNLCEPCFRHHERKYTGDNSHHLIVPCCLDKANALAQLSLVEAALTQLDHEEGCLQWKGRQLEKIETGLRRERDAYVNIARRQLANRLVQIENERQMLLKKHAHLKHICQTPAEQLWWKHGGTTVDVVHDPDMGIFSSRHPDIVEFEERMEEYATRTFQSLIRYSSRKMIYLPELFETNTTQTSIRTAITWPHSYPDSSRVQDSFPPGGSASLPQSVPVDLTHLAFCVRHLQQSVSYLQQTTTGLHAKVSDLEERHVRLVHDVSKLQENHEPLMTCLSAMQDGQEALQGTISIITFQNQQLVNEIVSLKEHSAWLVNRLALLQNKVARIERNESPVTQTSAENDDLVHHLQDLHIGEESETSGKCEGGQELAGSADQPEQTSPCAEPQPTSIEFSQDK